MYIFSCVFGVSLLLLRNQNHSAKINLNDTKLISTTCPFLDLKTSKHVFSLNQTIGCHIWLFTKWDLEISTKNCICKLFGKNDLLAPSLIGSPLTEDVVVGLSLLPLLVDLLLTLDDELLELSNPGIQDIYSLLAFKLMSYLQMYLPMLRQLSRQRGPVIRPLLE